MIAITLSASRFYHPDTSRIVLFLARESCLLVSISIRRIESAGNREWFNARYLYNDVGFRVVMI
jgi:hypothetical protein